MKIQALVAAVALAFGATAFAQTGAAASAGATDTPAATSEVKAEAKTPAKSKKKVKKAAKAKSTQSMGAGPFSPATDLEAPDRQSRMDQAYANWKAGVR